jgi:hypothetical protein
MALILAHFGSLLHPESRNGQCAIFCIIMPRAGARHRCNFAGEFRCA